MSFHDLKSDILSLRSIYHLLKNRVSIIRYKIEARLILFFEIYMLIHQRHRATCIFYSQYKKERKGVQRRLHG